MVGRVAVSGIFPRSNPFRIMKLWCKFKLACQLAVDDVGRNRHHRHGMGEAQWLVGKRAGADRRSHGGVVMDRIKIEIVKLEKPFMDRSPKN
jgi:hypothetical protein